MPLSHPEIGFKLILCDSAQTDAASGKLHMLGAGWTVVPTPTPPSAVALLVHVPWDRTNEVLPISVELLDGDGRPVHLPTSEDADEEPVRQEAQLEVGRPPGLAPGSTLAASFALNVGPLPLPPCRYEWRASVAESVQSEFFQVLPTGPAR